MGFMQIVANFGTWYHVTDHRGERTLVPGDLVGTNPLLAEFDLYVEGEPTPSKSARGGRRTTARQATWIKPSGKASTPPRKRHAPLSSSYMARKRGRKNENG